MEKLNFGVEAKGMMRGEGMSVHLFDDPAARLRLELSAPIATSGGVGVDAGDGGRVAPLSGSPVGAVHGTLLLLLRLLLDLRLGPRSPSNPIATNTTRWKKKKMMRRRGSRPSMRRARRTKMRKACLKENENEESERPRLGRSIGPRLYGPGNLARWIWIFILLSQRPNATLPV
jgi:hypothetical protein